MKNVSPQEQDRFSELVTQYWQPVAAVVFAILLAYGIKEFLSYKTLQYNQNAGDALYAITHENNPTESMYDEFIKQYPTSSWTSNAYLMRGVLRSSSTDQDGIKHATDDFNYVIQYSKDELLRDQARFNLGVMSLNNKESDQAIKSFSQMESLAYRIHANVYLAMIYHTNNQTDALKETLAFAKKHESKLDPSHVMIYASLSKAIVKSDTL